MLWTLNTHKLNLSLFFFPLSPDCWQGNWSLEWCTISCCCGKMADGEWARRQVDGRNQAWNAGRQIHRGKPFGSAKPNKFKFFVNKILDLIKSFWLLDLTWFDLTFDWLDLTWHLTDRPILLGPKFCYFFDRNLFPDYSRFLIFEFFAKRSAKIFWK